MSNMPNGKKGAINLQKAKRLDPAKILRHGIRATDAEGKRFTHRGDQVVKSRRDGSVYLNSGGTLMRLHSKPRDGSGKRRRKEAKRARRTARSA